MNKLNKQS